MEITIQQFHQCSIIRVFGDAKKRTVRNLQIVDHMKFLNERRLATEQVVFFLIINTWGLLIIETQPRFFFPVWLSMNH